jgi:hypothetical protein
VEVGIKQGFGHGFGRAANPSPRTQTWLVAGGIATAASIFLLLLLLPGTSYQTQNTWDILIFLDGADRLPKGSFQTANSIRR